MSLTQHGNLDNILNIFNAFFYCCTWDLHHTDITLTLSYRKSAVLLTYQQIILAKKFSFYVGHLIFCTTVSVCHSSYFFTRNACWIIWAFFIWKHYKCIYANNPTWNFTSLYLSMQSSEVRYTSIFLKHYLYISRGILSRNELLRVYLMVTLCLNLYSCLMTLLAERLCKS
jgi:hypothetical protein